MTYGNHDIKMCHTVEYSGCHIGSELSGKYMVMQVLNKVNAKLNFLSRHIKYLTPRVKGLIHTTKCNEIHVL